MANDDDANRIDPAEFATWIRIADAVKVLCKTWDYNTAQRAILKRLGLAQLKSAAEHTVWWQDGVANPRPYLRLMPLLWNSCEVSMSADMWDTGDIDLDPNQSGQYISLIDVRLKPDDFARLSPTNAAERVTSTTVALPDPAIRKGGRPRATWWDDLWIEMIRRNEAGRLNPTSAAQLEGWMDDWLRKQGFSPGDSTLKPSSLKLFKYLQERRGK